MMVEIPQTATRGNTQMPAGVFDRTQAMLT